MQYYLKSSSFFLPPLAFLPTFYWVLIFPFSILSLFSMPTLFFMLASIQILLLFWQAQFFIDSPTLPKFQAFLSFSIMCSPSPHILQASAAYYCYLSAVANFEYLCYVSDCFYLVTLTISSSSSQRVPALSLAKQRADFLLCLVKFTNFIWLSTEVFAYSKAAALSILLSFWA